MANYTLNYTGEKVDELLHKVDTTGGVMRVNVTYESIDQYMNFDGTQADKTYTEIKNHLDNGGFAYAYLNITGMGEVFVPIMSTGEVPYEGVNYPSYVFAAHLSMGDIQIHVTTVHVDIIISM